MKVIQFHSLEPAEHHVDQPTRIKLHDGALTLYKRPESSSDVWHFAIRTADGYQRKSTGTTDLDKAREIAVKAYAEIAWRVERGLSVKAVTFKQAGEAYLKELERERTTEPGKHVGNRATARKLQKYILPYFADMRLVDIRQKHVAEFQSDYLQHWEETRGVGFGPSKPSWSSSRLAESAIIGVLRHAVAIGMISDAERPVITRTKVVRTTRGDFKPHEEAAIFARLLADMNAPAPNPRQQRARALLYWYCCWLRATGMRPGTEPLSVVISELQYRPDRDPPDVKIHVNDGKVGPRSIIARQDEVVPIIDAVKELHRHPITARSRLFNVETNKRADWFGHNFHKVLADLGMLTDASGQGRSLYSFRHTCITDWIGRGRTLSWIAKNCGTSVHEIEHTYSHVIHTEQSSELKK